MHAYLHVISTSTHRGLGRIPPLARTGKAFLGLSNGNEEFINVDYLISMHVAQVAQYLSQNKTLNAFRIEQYYKPLKPTLRCLFCSFTSPDLLALH